MARSYGDTLARQLSQYHAAPAASLTALKALDAESVADGMVGMVHAAQSAGGGLWRYVAASTVTGDNVLVATPAHTPTAGRWCRMPGAVDLAIAITFATADAAALFTMPTGAVLAITDLYWEVTTSWTGGTNSAIGVSSNKTVPTNWSTKGDLLGGSAGDVEATLVSTAPGGLVAGTVGTDMDTVAKRRGAIWIAADTIRFDRITSVFTAGAGKVHVRGALLENNGA